MPDLTRQVINPKELDTMIRTQINRKQAEHTEKMYTSLAMPSYVHGYSLAIQYFTNWFESKFDKGYLQSVYIDGKHVIDDYKKFSDKTIIKAHNPRARIEPRVDYDYDRDNVDWHGASPEVYIRRSDFENSFFRDYDRKLFLSCRQRALKMNFNCKVRVNTRSQQLDLFNKMEMNFRIGATQYEYTSVDFHIPKPIILNIARRAGFEVANDNVINIIEFLAYLNSHSDIPFLFKLRAINQKPEYFIRVNGLYTHINTVDKLQLDDGERDGKLETNFHIEMNPILTMPIPYFYVFFSADELTDGVPIKEPEETSVAIYSINLFDIPRVDENGWGQAAITEYQTDEGDTEIDLSSIFQGDNSLTRAIHHDLTRGVSPDHFIHIVIYRGNDVAVEVQGKMDWKTKIFKLPLPEAQPDPLRIVMYYNREYINELDIQLGNYNKNRVDRTDFIDIVNAHPEDKKKK